MIRGLDNVYYFVTDVQQSVDFYHGVWGLPIMDQDSHWATLSLNGVRLGLHLADKNEVTSNAKQLAGAIVTMSVKNIDEAYTHFQKRGVRFIGEISRNPWGSHVAFADPDGNLLNLREAPAK